MEDIGGDRVNDDQEAVERNDENPYDEEHERHESDIFDKAFPLMDILDERFNSQNVFVLSPHRRCACHSLNLFCKYEIFKNMDPSPKNLFDSTDRKLKSIWAKQNRSAKVSDNIRKLLGKLFIINNETRWNSYFSFSLTDVKWLILLQSWHSFPAAVQSALLWYSLLPQL